MESVHDAKRLADLQALPLERKVQITQTRIIEYLGWCKRNGYNPVVSFSGGKDSTVLLHIARIIDPNIKAVFSNTGLEYPEIQRFVRRTENVDIVRPAMSFPEVITTYGYPVISKEVSEAIHYARKIRPDMKTVPRKRQEPNGTRPQNDSMRRQMLMGTFHEGGVSETDGKLSAFNKAKWLPVVQLPFKVSHYCCQTMKKSPLHKYQTASHAVPILATMAAESRVRKQAWIRKGCNAFDGAKSSSQPMSFWTEQDVLEYIQRESLEIAPVYGQIVGNECDGLHCTGCRRTGCIFCGFGAHMEKPGNERFIRLAETHPRQYEYCIGGGQWVDNPDFDPNIPEYDGSWKNWNPEKIWVPSKEGLGMGFVFDSLNEIYGPGFIRYK